MLIKSQTAKDDVYSKAETDPSLDRFGSTRRTLARRAHARFVRRRSEPLRSVFYEHLRHLPHLLGSFVRCYPKAEPRLKITNRANVLSSLAANESDLYVMGQPPEELPVIEYPFLENVLVVVARPDHPLAGETSITLERIAEERFVGRETGSGTRKAVEQMFAEKNLKIAPYIELASAEAIKQGVIGGLGIAVLSLHSLHFELDAGALVILDVTGFPLRRRWYAVHRKGKRLSRAAQTFLTYLEEEGEQEVAHLLTPGYDDRP